MKILFKNLSMEIIFMANQIDLLLKIHGTVHTMRFSFISVIARTTIQFSFWSQIT